MRVQSINPYSCSFQRKKKAQNNSGKKQTAPNTSNVLNAKLAEIKKDDKNFIPNPVIAEKLEQMSPEKLALFDNEVIKESLGREKKLTKITINDISIVERYSPEELNILMENRHTRNFLNALMAGYVPNCSIEMVKDSLKNTLRNSKPEKHRGYPNNMDENL